MRDIKLEDTFRHQFTTRAFATGIPTVLAGTPVLSVLEENNATPITAGVSISVDRAAVVGLNEVTVIATAANGYEVGKSYGIYISTGTVGGVSVVGEVVHNFTIELAPVNWARVTAPTTAVDLSVTDIQLVDTCTTNTDVRGTDSALLASSDGSGLTEAGGTGDHLTAINLPNQTMDIVGDITGNLSGSVGSVTGAVGSVTGAVGSVAGNVDGNVTGSVGSNLELGPAEVNAEVVDVLFTDTDAEPAKGAPGATISLADKIGFLYKAWRNRSTQTATTYSVFNDDATTVDHDATVSDDTTTADRGEMTDGP